MNSKLKCILLFLGIIGTVFSSAQEPITYYRLDLRDSVSEPVFLKSFGNSNDNIFFYKFSIFTRDQNNIADTVYSVNIDFDRTDNIIEVRQEDRHTRKFRARKIRFYPGAGSSGGSGIPPVYIVKDLRFNDTTLSVFDDNNAKMLFTILDTVHPTILLHQFVSLDNSFQYNLEKFRETYLKNHLAHARHYWQERMERLKKQAEDSLLSLNLLRRKIEDEKLRIRNDKDSLFRIIDSRWQELSLTNVQANSEAMNSFRQGMNKVFLQYYERDLRDKTIQGEYEILASPGPRIEILKKPDREMIKNDPGFCDVYLGNIDTAINHLWLDTEEVPLFPEDPVTIVLAGHEARFSEFKAEMSKKRISYEDEFDPVFQSIKNEIGQKFSKTTIEVPTRYSCPFNYSVHTGWEKWKMYRKRIRDDEGLEIDPDSKNYRFFFNSMPNAKNGTYRVKMNAATINETIIGPTAIDVRRKYKYTTRIGASVGIISPPESLIELALLPDRRYYDFFFTYHHLGFFGGFGSFSASDTETGSILQKYYEGGIYLAPGNIFYLKMGLSKYDTWQPMGGISFIFPGFQIEGGYNLAFKCPYVMAGLNIPLNL